MTTALLVALLLLGAAVAVIALFVTPARAASAMREAISGRLETLERAQERIERSVRDEIVSSRTEASRESAQLREEVRETLKETGDSAEKRLGELRLAVDAKLQAIQEDNGRRLEAMRQTVDEKLQGTLEKRLGESFKLVGDRLEAVQAGLGEMRTLASGVGDLKKVLTNVKVRGTWGEVQLGNLLGQMLAPEQFVANVATRPQTSERVEYAVRLPGLQDGEEVLLPIDSKFPTEDYQRLVEASERGDAEAVEASARQLEQRIKLCAEDIRSKYLNPPHTTDFGILFLPTEGLYAEVIRRGTLAEVLQRDYRVAVAGPTTLAALLNSLQMGFRTLAIEQRSSEVWELLSAVKTEFSRFGDVLAKTKQQLQTVTNSIGQAETRTRQMTRKLKDVEALPVPQAELLLGKADDAAEEDDAAA